MTMAVMKLEDDVVDVLKRSTVSGNSLTLPQQLDRKLYEKVNKAITLIGGKWNRSAKAHVFQQSGDEIKALWTDAVESGEIVDKVKSYQLYQTPRKLVEKMMELAALHFSRGITILEPSAGLGAILDVVREKHPDFKFHAMELDPDKVILLRDKGYSTIYGDFETFDCAKNLPPIDCIIANPPFSKKRDVKHILRMWDVIRPGGVVVSIAGAAVKSNSDKLSRKLQAIVKEHGRFYETGEKAFTEEGTNVSTCFVVLTKLQAA